MTKTHQSENITNSFFCCKFSYKAHHALCVLLVRSCAVVHALPLNFSI